MAARRYSRNRAPSYMRDTYYPPVQISEASTWRDINDELEQPKKRGLKRLLMMMGGGHGRARG